MGSGALASALPHPRWCPAHPFAQPRPRQVALPCACPDRRPLGTGSRPAARARRQRHRPGAARGHGPVCIRARHVDRRLRGRHCPGNVPRILEPVGSGPCRLDAGDGLGHPPAPNVTVGGWLAARTLTQL